MEQWITLKINEIGNTTFILVGPLLVGAGAMAPLDPLNPALFLHPCFANLKAEIFFLQSVRKEYLRYMTFNLAIRLRIIHVGLRADHTIDTVRTTRLHVESHALR